MSFNDEFFTDGNELSNDATVISSGEVINGYFDILGVDFYLNDAAGAVDAQMICQQREDINDLVGDELQVLGVNYRINQIKPDGTGLVTLELLKV